MIREIPSIDLSLFSNPETKMQMAEELGHAFKTTGFVSVKNHGIRQPIIDDLYKETQHFFALPEHIKRKYEPPALHGQRGYTSFGKEHAKDSKQGDLKEFWHFGQYVEDGDPIAAEYPENIYCEELPLFNAAGRDLFKNLEDCGKIILQAIALYLKLEQTYFDKWVHNGNSILRAIHYPPIVQEPESAIRAGAHEDINLITLLVGASAEGLEILTTEGNWIPVTAVQDHLIVNVGDMLQRLTNNQLRSTTHRVVNPPKDKWQTPRFSIPFFMHPRSEMPLNCLENCCDSNHPASYEDITAGEYLNERLIEIGLKK